MLGHLYELKERYGANRGFKRGLEAVMLLNGQKTLVEGIKQPQELRKL
ncbi:hypothetical protein [Bacillus toyonensis]|nr:hypothetical protein [Bacillus toyonensis]